MRVSNLRFQVLNDKPHIYHTCGRWWRISSGSFSQMGNNTLAGEFVRRRNGYAVRLS